MNIVLNSILLLQALKVFIKCIAFSFTIFFDFTLFWLSIGLRLKYGIFSYVLKVLECVFNRLDVEMLFFFDNQ